MMCGLLRTREQAVSLEAYGTVITPYLHNAPKQLAEGVAEGTKMMNSDDVTKTDYGRLQLAFSAVFNHTVITIAQSIAESLGKSPEERSLLMLQSVRKLSECEEAARLRYCLILSYPTLPPYRALPYYTTLLDATLHHYNMSNISSFEDL